MVEHATQESGQARESRLPTSAIETPPVPTQPAIFSSDPKADQRRKNHQRIWALVFLIVPPLMIVMFGISIYNITSEQSSGHPLPTEATTTVEYAVRLVTWTFGVLSILAWLPGLAVGIWILLSHAPASNQMSNKIAQQIPVQKTPIQQISIDTSAHHLSPRQYILAGILTLVLGIPAIFFAVLSMSATWEGAAVALLSCSIPILGAFMLFWLAIKQRNP